MNFRSILDRLDDESGCLALSLSKLNLEHSRGISCGPEEADFVEDVFQAISRKYLRPWRTGAVTAFSIATTVLVGSVAASHLSGANGWLPLALRGLGGLGIASSVGAYFIYKQRKARFDKEIESARKCIANGISIFDTEYSWGPE